MIKTVQRHDASAHGRMLRSCLTAFLSFVLVFGGLPADAFAEALETLPEHDEALEEVAEEALGVSDVEGTADELQKVADGSEEPAVTEEAPESEQSQVGEVLSEEEQASEAAPAKDATASEDAGATAAAETDASDVAVKEEPAQPTVVKEESAQPAATEKGQAQPTAVEKKSQPVADDAPSTTAEPVLKAQATASPQTIKAAGFNLTLPSFWSGEVEVRSSKLSGYNVGTLTSIWMVDGNGLIEIHCARRSEFKRVTGWGDVCLIGTKKNADYVVEVYMCYWPWMDFDAAASSYSSSSSTTDASDALWLLTDGEYSWCGSSSSASYSDSFECAKAYVKNNILDKIALKKAPVTGKWVQSGNRWWYQLSNGTYPKSTFRKISGATYYFDASGWMVTGWRKISGSWYYFYSNGKRAESAWIQSGSTWYRMGSTGKMLTGWQTVAKKRYWFDKSGAMATGWKKIAKKWYYFESSGAMAKSKWVGNYYLQKDGTMATNKWIGKYHVNASGLWDKTK